MTRINSYPLPLIVDSTVIFNFGIIGKFCVLEKLYGKQIIIPTDVKLEISTSPVVGPLIDDKIKEGTFEEYTINYECSNREIKDYIYLKKRFGNGESACLAISKNWKCTIATDDMTAAKKYCEKNNISLIGTLGILYQAYRECIINKNEGQAILDDMINIREYKSPTNDFDDIITWFEKHEGQELF
ncbi:hypothetical protein [Clostridium perfringens]|uniref:hypothetical protein n=1 Tax=Clostridium perfringens TaxID=1502 RepID=UPI0010946259|nr:hypothetical protein [Clostridium perfringens]TGY42475.1 hypothetical protein E5346_14285 [Clostridium perfringens]